MIDKNIKYAELDANALTFDFDICLPNPVISRIFFFKFRQQAEMISVFRSSATFPLAYFAQSAYSANLSDGTFFHAFLFRE